MRFLLFVGVALAVTACAPRTVTPIEATELLTAMAYQDAFAAVVTAVNTMPYPSNSGGWVLTQSDQVGGFVSAQLNGRSCGFLVGCTDWVARVSVALVNRGSETSVSVSLNRHREAVKLKDEILASLGLTGGE